MKESKNLELLIRTTDKILPEQDLAALVNTDKPLRIKYGVDVTAPFLHIGHAVNLWQMRLMQDFGHKVVFLIGDFTTRIGDPTGKSQTRPVIPQEEIEKNADAFIKQVSRILKTDSELFEVRRNSEWYEKMPLHEFLGLLSQVTHSHMVQRDMFQTRIKEGKEIRMHELVYPILQGYDSYMLKSDLTVVGSDQLFNENMGRFFQNKFGQPSQVVVTTRITPGLDGVNKQSKSLNNYIALDDTPRNKFGKVMSLPDSLIMPYFEVYSDLSNQEIAAMREALDGGANPSHIKKKLSSALVARYHGEEAAKLEAEWFDTAFSSRKSRPENLPSLTAVFQTNAMKLVQEASLGHSNTQIRRLCEQGGIKVNGQKITDPYANLDLADGDVLHIGKKHLFEIKLEKK